MALESIPKAACFLFLFMSLRSFFFAFLRSRSFRSRAFWISFWIASSSSSPALSPSEPSSSPSLSSLSLSSLSLSLPTALAFCCSFQMVSIFSLHMTSPLKSPLFNNFRSTTHSLISDVVNGWFNKKVHLGQCASDNFFLFLFFALVIALTASHSSHRKEKPVQVLSVWIAFICEEAPKTNLETGSMCRMVPSRCSVSYPPRCRLAWSQALWKTLNFLSAPMVSLPPPCVSPSTNSKMCFGSSSRGSILSGL
mmetsp:Transcript_19853/g.46297  ORF Transcript_19853/g.46297 Transcript_19853/m.46297 type:complete len:252 (-) Transcript_19853:77-832(-)